MIMVEITEVIARNYRQFWTYGKISTSGFHQISMNETLKFNIFCVKSFGINIPQKVNWLFYFAVKPCLFISEIREFFMKAPRAYLLTWPIYEILIWLFELVYPNSWGKIDFIHFVIIKIMM